MIAFGCAIHSEEKYERFARPGIERVRDPEAPLIELRDRHCIFTAYNEILDRVRDDPRIETLVLIHEDTEIRDSRFEAKIRWVLSDPLVAIVGTVGAVGVRGIDWWIHDYGIGSSILEPIDPEALYETPLLEGAEISGSGHSGEVDMVDGYLLALSRWAIRELRFDADTLGPGFHGYDADICFQARERGKRVIVGDFELIHHTAARLGEREGWLRAHVAFARKWEGRLLPVDGGKAGVGAATAPGDERAQPAAFA
jgi:hypothetical protein